ncbi:MAG: YitT family protein [Myxococcota bacterium]|nr:YitT family protein [Myxococcota bacterium]
MRQLRLKNFLAILLGSVVVGFGVNYFNIANNLAEGGVTGIAILLKLAFGLDPGLSTFVINIPLLLIGWKVLGRYTLIYTIFGTVCLAAALTLFGRYRLVLDDLLLASLYAGVTVGIGLGIVFRFGGTTGGVDIVARILEKYFGWKIGRTLFFADLAIVAASLFYLNLEQAMYTMVAIFIGTRTVDFVQEAAYTMRAAHIISEKSDEIARRIMAEMDRGVTLLQAMGGFTGTPRQIVYVIVSRSEIVKLKQLILSIDPVAFVSITESGDVMGRGFTLDPMDQEDRMGTEEQSRPR